MVGQPYIDQIRVGELKQYSLINDNTRQTKLIKSPLLKRRVKGSVWVNQTGIMGDDGIDEREVTRDKALFAYAKEHYSYWQEDKPSLHPGQMGEQLVINHLNEYNIFIGDTFQVGDAIIQVSQPRIPCWRIAYHLSDHQFAKKIKQSGHTGWHLRVLKDGFIKEDNKIQLINRPYPQWSIAICNELLYTKDNLNMLYELTNCHLLSERWLTLIKERLKGRAINFNKRFYGPLNYI